MGKWVRKGRFSDLSTKIFDQPFLIFPFRPFSPFLLIVSLNHLFSFSILFHSTVSISQPSIFLFYPVLFHCLYLSTVCFPLLSCFIPLSLSLNHLFSFSILFHSTFAYLISLLSTFHTYHIFLSSKLAPISPVLLTHTLPIIYLPWSSIYPSPSIYPSCLIKYNFSILLSTLDLKRFDLDQLIRGVKPL